MVCGMLGQHGVRTSSEGTRNQLLLWTMSAYPIHSYAQQSSQSRMI